ncbi:hypothetical protein GCM10010187_47670 [Actinomadura coerulea]|nr:hypothetical protein GCM10010187_47670 [Actinomadura coerulea]
MLPHGPHPAHGGVPLRRDRKIVSAEGSALTWRTGDALPTAVSPRPISVQVAARAALPQALRHLGVVAVTVTEVRPALSELSEGR